MVFTLGFALAFGTFGCSTDTSFEGNPYAEEFTQAIEKTDSEFVRAILEDGLIDEAEFDEAVQKCQECLDQAGSGITIRVDKAHAYVGWSYPGPDNLEVLHQIEDQCSDEWLGDIAYLYTDVLRNPDNLEWNDIFPACLVRHGLAPEGFTREVYEELNVNVPAPDNGVLLPDGTIIPGGEVFDCVYWPMK